MAGTLSTLPWGEIVIALLGGGGLAKAADVVFGRKGREMKAMSDALDSLSGQLEAADVRMDSFGKRLDECHDLHEDCEKGRQEDRLKIAGLEAKVQAQIDALMKGDVPSYHTIQRTRKT